MPHQDVIGGGDRTEEVPASSGEGTQAPPRGPTVDLLPHVNQALVAAPDDRRQSRVILEQPADRAGAWCLPVPGGPTLRALPARVPGGRMT